MEITSLLFQHLRGISRGGNGHQRGILTECAEHYALPPKISNERSARQANTPEVLALSSEAQNRLHLRFTAC